MRQAFSFQVGVPLEHRQRLVAAYHADLNWVKPLFKQPCHSLVAQVMEPQSTQKLNFIWLRRLSLGHCKLKCVMDTVIARAEQPAIDRPRQRIDRV